MIDRLNGGSSIATSFSAGGNGRIARRPGLAGTIATLRREPGDGDEGEDIAVEGVGGGAYTDVPTRPQWRTDSNVKGSRRSKELKQIDVAVEAYDGMRHSTDLHAKRDGLRAVEDYIREWEKKKLPAGVAASQRTPSINKLKAIVVKLVQENLDAHEVELQPLVVEYMSAVNKHKFALAKTKGAALDTAHDTVYQTAATDALKSTDKAAWCTAFFAAPIDRIGAPPINSLTIKAIADWTWLTKTWANRAIDEFILPAAESQPNQIVAMLQYPPFRNALLEKGVQAEVGAARRQDADRAHRRCRRDVGEGDHRDAVRPRAGRRRVRRVPRRPAELQPGLRDQLGRPSRATTTCSARTAPRCGLRAWR